MEQKPRRVINLSDLPTRKFVPEEPITEEHRAKMLAKGQALYERHNPTVRQEETPGFVDATLSVPIVMDTSVSCDATFIHC